MTGDRDWTPTPRDSDLAGGPGSPSPRSEPGFDWRRLAPRLVLGLGLVAAGILFTLDNVGIVDADDYFRLWPLLLVLLGVSQIAAGRSLSDLLGGTVWIAIGGWILLYNLGWVRYSVFELWPLLLVLFGLVLIFRAVKPGTSAASETGATAHGFACMSGVVRRVSSPAFEGGSFTAVMGGCEVDLRQSELAGGRATVDTLAVWGGVEIYVPPTWTVTGRVLPIMGAFEDNTTPPAPEEAGGELVVTGFAVMGGVEVKN